MNQVRPTKRCAAELCAALNTSQVCAGSSTAVQHAAPAYMPVDQSCDMSPFMWALHGAIGGLLNVDGASAESSELFILARAQKLTCACPGLDQMCSL